MITKQLGDFPDRELYKKHVLTNAKNLEFSFFFTANGNGLDLEWQKPFQFYTNDRQTVWQTLHCDFYWQDQTGNIRIVIECDDGSHTQREKEDKMRDDYLHSLGIIVMRFSAKEIIWNCLECVDILKKNISSQREKLSQQAQQRRLGNYQFLPQRQQDQGTKEEPSRLKQFLTEGWL